MTLVFDSAMMRTRSASPADAERIHQLISAYSNDGTLLPRSCADVYQNIQDFVVLEERAGVVGCGALHIFGPHLAEIRSITVARDQQRRGGGTMLVQVLLSRAEKQKINSICLFTRTPGFFAKLGFGTVQRSDLPEKIYHDCCVCPRYRCCDQVAMIKGELPRFTIASEPVGRLIKLETRARATGSASPK